MYLKIFSNRLKDLMEMEGESKRSLSIKLNVDRKSIRCWLSEKFFPKYDALIKLSAHFKVRIDYLVGLEDTLEEERRVKNDKEIPIEEAQGRFLELLNRYMTEHKLTNYAMAKNLDIDQKSFTKWLRNGSMPETATLIKLAQLTGIPIHTLLGRE